MSVQVRLVTDPACIWSWATEPKLCRLRHEFGAELEIRWVMGGMARTVGDSERERYAESWLEAPAESGMPVDPRLWTKGGISSTYPACQAVVAAAEQGPDAAGRYLRRLREGLICELKRLDHPDGLTAEAGAAGLDVARFEVDLQSNAIVEKFAAHLDEARRIPDQAKEEEATGCTGPIERVTFPSLTFIDGDGGRRGVYGWRPYEEYRAAALDAGASPRDPGPLEVMQVFELDNGTGRWSTAEIEALTGRPRVVVEAELWGLARDWRLKPTHVLTGTLWERA